MLMVVMAVHSPRHPLDSQDISSFMPGSQAGFGGGGGGVGDTYVISGTTGHLRASSRSVVWR